MPILVTALLLAGALIGVGFRMRPAATDDDPSPDSYSDEERQALIGLQRAHAQHVMRMAVLRDRQAQAEE